MPTKKEIADYIITRCINNKRYITNQQLQDILYQLHTKEKLLQDATFEKADWGFYETNIFYDFITNGTMPITTNPEKLSLSMVNTTTINNIIDNYTRKE